MLIVILFIHFYQKTFLFYKIMPPHEGQVKKEDDRYLLDMIKHFALKNKEQPENAYIDKIWKKTPGRNGLTVNIDRSYEKMKQIGFFDESFIIYDEIEPNIMLDDLPASPIYRGHPKKEMVALMINVSWGSEHIPSILETLKENGVKATFFIEGRWAQENKQLLEMIIEENHLIGNHAYNHPDMVRISQIEAKDQIERTNKIIEAITNERPMWFAPPSGSFNQSVVEIAHDLKMQTILWTVDTIDWKNPSVSVMINRVMSKIHPGATVLMHPTEPVVQGLPTLIMKIKQEGYRIGTVEQLLSETR